MPHYLAFDLGAESGRAILGTLSGDRLEIEELHRFPNTMVREGDGLYWDFDRLWSEIQAGIRIATREGAAPLGGIGIDTWGVDVGLIDAQGQLLGRPRHYRDPRNREAMQKVLEIVPRDQVFEYTGIQFMQINSLYQVFAMRLAKDEALQRAHRLLHIPDLFNFRLTGVAKSEATIASTSQFFNPRSMAWATELFKRLDLRGEILGPIVPAGTLLGKMLEPPHTPVYATAGHDTAAAVAAVPAEAGNDWCYVSSGTWSLMGVELGRSGS
jgi:rhamnulokinase